MPLVSGVHVGRYQIVSPLGAGGMGEVYRARDPQLGRDVALKVVAGDEPSPDRLRRFEHEARAVAALRHPHILGIHDTGLHDGRPYLVLELLEGETLRQRLERGALPVRKALEIAGQVCAALAAAHAGGIVHRDLKPENLFLAPEGVKVLDFGLAKLTGAAEPAGSVAPTETATDRGAWLGTPGYVSPEQLRGEAASARSDIFALGAVLYEMLTGRRAFKGATRAHTLSAILQEEPPEMTSAGGPAVPAPLERVVRRCLEKDPEDRFQSARDVAFALDAISGTGKESALEASIEARTAARRWLPRLAIAVAAAAVFASGALVGRARVDRPAPTFRALTFRRGWMQQARFAPDGRSVIYAAAWDGQPLSLYEARTDSAGARPLGIGHANILAVSSQGKMAFVVNSLLSGYVGQGTLSVAPMGGSSAPREVLRDVQGSDWTPDGRLFVTVRRPNEVTFELPPGNVVYRRPGGAGFVRLSPDGRHVAFTSNGALVVLDLARGLARPLVERLGAWFWGLAWAPSSREVWFTQGESRDAKDIWAVDLSGRRRLVYRSAVDLSVLDIAPDGRALLHRSACRDWVALLGRGLQERDVSVGSNTVPTGLSADGRTLLLNEAGGVYLRTVEGEPVRLADGRGVDLSRDGRAALVVRDDRLDWVPTGADLPRTIDTGISRVTGALFVPPDGQRALVSGVDREGQIAPYRIVSLDPGAPAEAVRTVAPPGRGPTFLALSPDGRQLAGIWKTETLTVLPLDGREPRDVGRVPPYFGVRRWSDDGRSIFLANPGQGLGCTLARFDLGSSRFEPVREVVPQDLTGVNNCDALVFSGDGVCAAGYARCLTDLVLAEGLR